MTFEEKMRRNSKEDQIEIGQIVEAATSGQFGDLLRCIIAGITAEELAKGRDKESTTSSDRVLGRIESLDLLTERLDTCVDIKNQLVAEEKEKTEVKSGEVPNDSKLT